MGKIHNTLYEAFSPQVCTAKWTKNERPVLRSYFVGGICRERSQHGWVCAVHKLQMHLHMPYCKYLRETAWSLTSQLRFCLFTGRDRKFLEKWPLIGRQEILCFCRTWSFVIFFVRFLCWAIPNPLSFFTYLHKVSVQELLNIIVPHALVSHSRSYPTCSSRQFDTQHRTLMTEPCLLKIMTTYSTTEGPPRLQFRSLYCWLEVSIRKVLRPATSTQVFLGFPVYISKCWDGSKDSKLPLHGSHVALPT